MSHEGVWTLWREKVRAARGSVKRRDRHWMAYRGVLTRLVMDGRMSLDEADRRIAGVAKYRRKASGLAGVTRSAPLSARPSSA